MKYKNALLVVKDMDRSIDFYRNVFGLKVIVDFGANKTLTGGLCLQTLDTFCEFIHKTEQDILLKNHAVELYFEEDDFDAFLKKLDSIKNVEYLHGSEEAPWGQRSIRLYDPDFHVLEIGENIKSVAKRFFKKGMTVSQIAKRMDVDVKYVERLLK